MAIQEGATQPPTALTPLRCVPRLPLASQACSSSGELEVVLATSLIGSKLSGPDEAFSELLGPVT